MGVLSKYGISKGQKILMQGRWCISKVGQNRSYEFLSKFFEPYHFGLFVSIIKA